MQSKKKTPDPLVVGSKLYRLVGNGADTTVEEYLVVESTWNWTTYRKPHETWNRTPVKTGRLRSSGLATSAVEAVKIILSDAKSLRKSLASQLADCDESIVKLEALKASVR